MNEFIHPLFEAKKHFKEQLAKGKVLEFGELKLNAEDENVLSYHELLNHWYELITSFKLVDFTRPGLQEIITHDPLHIEIHSQQGKKLETSDITSEDFSLMLECLAVKNGQNWNYENPFVSFQAKIQSINVRVSLIHYSTNPQEKSKAFIRILNDKAIPLRHYNEAQRFLSMISDKENIIIAGATGSGKTTFANSLLAKIPKNEHLVIIEDTFELISHSHFSTRLLADDLNTNKSMNEYLKYTLRMSPERIVLGELRGKEIETALLALNTGHNGFISTIHANSALDAINRMALLFKIYSNKDLSYQLVLKLVTSNIDYIIYLKDKQVFEIIKVFGSENDQIFHETIFSNEKQLHEDLDFIL